MVDGKLKYKFIGAASLDKTPIHRRGLPGEEKKKESPERAGILLSVAESMAASRAGPDDAGQ